MSKDPPLLPEIAPAPAGDGGFHVLQVPLQGALALGAAPAAEVLAGLQDPPQSELPEGFAADAEPFADFGCGDPSPLPRRTA